MKTPALFLAAGSTLLSLATGIRFPPAAGQGSDLAHYMSRPDLRAPLLKVNTYEADAVTPGYWFTSPFKVLAPGKMQDEYIPYQSGPHIYDHRGELVWSGGPMFEYRNVFDFRVGEVNSSKALTAIVDSSRLLQSNYSMRQSGFILNEKYQVAQEIELWKTYNMHEFNSIDNNRIIIATNTQAVADLVDLGMPNRTIRVQSGGFRELDITTGKTVFEWLVIDHVSVTDSMTELPELYRTWDLFHLNSVTKDARGDYLISLRHASTIYKVSGKDGSIIWRLGGKHSDFQQNFNFSSQHHARILAEDDTGMTITLFDNASNDSGAQANTANASSMQVIKIYDREEPRRAELLAQYVRPDGQLTVKRGSAQILESGNAFICWSMKGYISEHTSDGRLVLEASFLGDRFDTYRAYHFADWVGQPAEPPALISYAHTGGSLKTLPSTVLYVSWNGATEVASWTFYGASSVGGSDNTFHKLGSVSKVSFESSMAVDGYWPHTYAEAYDAHGNLLGTSEVKVTVLPEQAESRFEQDGDSGIPYFSASLSMSEDALTLQASKPVAGFSTFVALVCILYTAISLSLRAWGRWRLWSRRYSYRGLQDHEKTLGEDETNALYTYPDVRSEKDEEEENDDEVGRHGAREEVDSSFEDGPFFPHLHTTAAFRTRTRSGHVQ